MPEVRLVVHLHGFEVKPDSDGYQEAWFTNGSPVWQRGEQSLKVYLSTNILSFNSSIGNHPGLMLTAIIPIQVVSISINFAY